MAENPPRSARSAIAPPTINAFWLAAGPSKWFAQDAAFDSEIRRLFHDEHHAAARGERAAWEADSEGAIALILLLDQFPRNLFRGSAHAYACDGLARRIAADAVERGFDRACDPALRVFFYLPFEHAENAADQRRAVALCDALPNAELYQRFARLHAELIDRFGRFPHRNAALGRVSTPEEKDFLASGGFAG